jgi:hypothetical protein
MKHLVFIFISIIFLSFNDYCCDLSKLYGKWQILEVEENNKIYLAKNFNDCNKKETMEFRDSTFIETNYYYSVGDCSIEKHNGIFSYKIIHIGQENNNKDKYINIYVNGGQYKVLTLNDTILKLWREYPNRTKTYRRVQKQP